jgi:hypothetical protein
MSLRPTTWKWRAGIAAILLAGLGGVLKASGELPGWVQEVVGESAIESALYRLMAMPGLDILYPRPTAEARGQLSNLLVRAPADVELYSLRAHAEEQSLDFVAAESDWKSYVAHAQDTAVANLQLADFYERRLRSQDEIAALLLVGNAASPLAEKYLPIQQQRSWRAFARILRVVDDQALPPGVKVSTYRSWIARYPAEPSTYASLVSLLIDQQNFHEATLAIGEYRRAFPGDQVFPLKAAALIEYRRGSATQALAVYEHNFKPLWPSELVQSYFAMLSAAHRQRQMLSEARAKLIASPDDLSSAALIFYYYQQEGRLDAARNAVEEYRTSKDRRKAPWSAEELYTFATLLDGAAQYDEAARYYFALYSAAGSIPDGAFSGVKAPQEVALTGMVRILLKASDQGISLGSGNLSIYSDIATVDSGPGYLNGILSLWLNSESPRREFNEEEKRGLPYFHRAKAAELLGMFDAKFPFATARAELHADLIQAYAGYGQDSLVIKAGNEFLGSFPDSSRRVPVAMLIADAYARTGKTASEFALYNRMLEELAAKAGGMPLTASEASRTVAAGMATSAQPSEGNAGGGGLSMTDEGTAKPTVESALSLTVTTAAETLLPGNLTYGQVLDRYLGRLTMEKKLPDALAVLRRELDRNPNDPLLYEKLADFLQQNNFSAQEEEVYRRAIDRFKSRDWYDRLARLFIREKRRQDYASVTRQVVDTFRGTDLEGYFSNVNEAGPQLALQLNLYAHRRFPHDLKFTRNLLTAYRSPNTINPVAWEKLMREHWFESTDLNSEFFDYLSSNGKLAGEITALQSMVLSADQSRGNMVALRELADADLWQSHFEESAPLLGWLAASYPADVEIGTQASSVYRSLACFDPAERARAVAVEKNLSDYEPANLDRLARLGDILADGAGADPRLLAVAASYWRRMPLVHPGLQDGYLQAATIFWDYFQFDDAMAQIAAARRQFHDPALYGYEAGAIYENEHDIGKAVAEYVAAAVTGNSQARNRLIALSTRPASAELVDAATRKAVAEQPTLNAIGLRADILGREKRNEIAALVDSAVDRASTLDSVEQLGTFAQQHNLAASYQHALRREIAMAADPVQRIEIQYALVQSLVTKDDVASAQQIIESVYKDNQKVMGVVRATADFYWDHKQPQRAIATLIQASHDAYPELSKSYSLEAADKSNEAGDYASARRLVGPLLDADPYGPDSAKCLAVIADSYARANDDSGLRDFYLGKLDGLKSAQLAASSRRDQAALLRRGLILALTRMKDYAGGVDQHTALISAFPEDAAVIQDAALYALRYGRQQQLQAFLNKGLADSPRDSRFAIALGSVDTLFEDYSGAIDAYGRAIALRKDRSDIYIARADLEERLQRFDDACADYSKLYFLTYNDPQWMMKTAEARARQGRNKDAVQALRTAWIDGHPAEAKNYFNVASQLEKWDILDEASSFASQGVKLAGDDLLASGENHEGVAIYARILTRQRRSGEALKTLETARDASDVSPLSPAIVLQQAEKQGLAAVSDEEWRRNRVEQRKQQAKTGFENAVLQMSTAVATYFTPEEKLAYARLLDGREVSALNDDVETIWIPAAMTAGLKDREARWRQSVLVKDPKFDQGKLDAFNLLEKQRMENAERGRTLEEYAERWQTGVQDGVFAMAEDGWRDAGDHEKELAVLRRMDFQSKPQANLRERYFHLLLRYEPKQLVAQAGLSPADYADSAANYAFANGSQPLAYAAIDARAAKLAPVWHDANTALAGLYFADQTASADAAFRRALDDRNIGERVAGAADTSRHVTGNSWFYYGMRYGVYRQAAQTGDAEDYLASGLEGESSSASSYVSLAEAYADADDIPGALREYGHGLELAPATVAIHRDIAVLLWSSDRKEEALDQWKQALDLLRKQVNTRVVPESFWIDFAAIAQDVHQRRMFDQLRPQMDAVLRAYIAKNGDYRTVELLHSAFIAADTPAYAVGWILSLIDAARNPETVLAQLDGPTWLPAEQLGKVLRRQLELAQTAPRLEGDSSNYASHRLARMQLRLLQYLVGEKKDAEAEALYDSIPDNAKRSEPLQIIRLVLAARTGTMGKLLAEFRSNPDVAPAATTIAAAASELRDSGDQADNRLLLEYVFDFKSTRHELAESDFLALAEARLDTADVAGAAELLHRMTLSAPDLYGSLDSAADLLERSGHVAEALPFLTTLATNTPWKPEYRWRLARARQARTGDVQSTVPDLVAVAASSEASYGVRVRAALGLKGRGGSSDLHSAELALLASGKTILPAQADQPYFLPARLGAVNTAAADARPEILRKAIAVVPSDRLRLAIFRAEFALGHDDLALAAVQPLLDFPAGYVQTADSDPDSVGGVDGSEDVEEIATVSAESDSGGTRGENEAVYAAIPALLTTVKERVEFALAVATLDEHDGNDEQALSYVRFAARINRDAGRRAEIASRVEALRSRVQVERDNNSRRPVIHESLDQAIVVRPRIANSAAQQVQP